MNLHRVEPLIDGFPGKSETHGAFGWSSVWLISGPERTMLVDTGGHAYVPVLRAELGRRGLSFEDVTDVLLTHAHWDHSANFTLFPRARVWIGADELDWARRQSPGDHFLSELHVDELARRADRDDGMLRRLKDEETIAPGIRSILVPGHTPGHLALVVQAEQGPVVFAGDSVKNIRELHTLEADSTMDAAQSRRSIARIRELMREGAVLVPGHDVLLRLEDGAVRRQRAQRAQITFFATREGEGADRSIEDR